MDAFAVALLVAFTSIVSPMLLAWLTNRQRRQEKIEDYARLDVVAAQAAEAARLLVQTNKAVAEVGAQAAIAAQGTNDKLDTIHVLVNSNMTAAMRAELDARKAQLVVMEEMMALNLGVGREPSPAATAAIDGLAHQIDELAANLDDRLSQSGG